MYLQKARKNQSPASVKNKVHCPAQGIECLSPSEHNFITQTQVMDNLLMSK